MPKKLLCKVSRCLRHDSLNQNSDISVALAFLARDEISSKHLELTISYFFLIVHLSPKNKITNGSLAREFFQNGYRAIVSTNVQTC